MNKQYSLNFSVTGAEEKPFWIFLIYSVLVKLAGAPDLTIERTH